MTVCRRCKRAGTPDPLQFAEEVAADAAHASGAGYGDVDDELERFRRLYKDTYGQRPKGGVERMFRNTYEDIKDNQSYREPHPGDRPYSMDVSPRDYDRYSRRRSRRRRRRWNR